MDKQKVKSILECCNLFDNLITERTEQIDMFHEKVIPNCVTDKDKLELLYLVGKLSEELAFIKASAYAYLQDEQRKNSSFSFWMGVM